MNDEINGKDLWMDDPDNLERLSDIDPDNADDACNMIYNLHEDALVLRERNTELQTKLAESEARVLRLEEAANCINHWHDSGPDGMVVSSDHVRNLWQVLNETKSQSLQHIQAEAVEKAKVTSQMKADCMGEVSFVIENGNCCPQCWHEQDDDCDICHGESGESGSSNLTVQVPWDTMKDIWKMMNQSYARELRQQQTNGE